jgi:hypothetical protein
MMRIFMTLAVLAVFASSGVHAVGVASSSLIWD